MPDPLADAVATLSDRSTSAAVDAVISQIAQAHLDRIAERMLLMDVKRRTGLPFAITETKLTDLKRALVPINGHSSQPDWMSEIILGERWEPLPIAANVVTLLRNDPAWSGCFAFDEFRQTPVFIAKPPYANGHWPTDGDPVPISDVDENQILVWVQRNGIHCRIEAVRQALSILVDENCFHPIRDYLSNIKWDGRQRLDNWPTYYLGVEPIENYTSLVGARWMISAVARIFQPGCMAKYALILEGPQDLSKSTALEVLGSPWFTDDIDELGSKDSKLQVGNAWIVELAELDSLRKAEISAIKAFISRKADRFRRPFGRYVMEQPRQCVLAGTVNPSGQYFHDETGSVRFWPLKCTAIDIPALKTDRDQLWAEAVARYHQGEKWWLDLDEQALAASDEQDQRFAVDVWSARINRWLQEPERALVEFVTIDDILENCLGLKLGDCGRNEATRVGIILNRLNWLSKQIRVRGGRERRYFRPFSD